MITAEEVMLTGRSVKNSGTITSASGSVKLAAGNAMEIHSSNGVLGVESPRFRICPQVRLAIGKSGYSSVGNYRSFKGRNKGP